jgi:hypothetical protein
VFIVNNVVNVLEPAANTTVMRPASRFEEDAMRVVGSMKMATTVFFETLHDFELSTRLIFEIRSFTIIDILQL